MIENEGLVAFVVSIPAFLLVAFTVVDIFRRPDLAPLRKAIWLVVVVLLPGVGTLFYLVARPFRDPAANAATVDEEVGALVEALVQHERGELEGEAFAAKKRAILGDATGGYPQAGH